MQNYILSYADEVMATMRAPSEPVSIAVALAVLLPKMDRGRISELIAAAVDLRRILELELERRDSACEQATYYGCVACQNFHFEGDPMFERHLMQQSKHGLQRGLRPVPEQAAE